MIDPRFFKSNSAITIEQVEQIACGEIISNPNPDNIIATVAALTHENLNNAVVFITDSKYLANSLKSTPALCLVPENLELVAIPVIFKNTAFIKCANPKASFALLAAELHTSIFEELDSFENSTQNIPKSCFIHQSAVLGANVEIGENVRIGPNAVIGSGCVIGDNCRIGANTTITHAKMGRDCHILPGATIGQAGFGFTYHKGKQLRIPQLGRVILEDEVEIGSCSTIDRGMLNDTIIGAQTKIDNLVQIAHNVQLGERCAIASQTGISGSTVVGNGVLMGGQVGIVDHVKIGNGSVIFARSALMKDMPENEKWGGTPAKPARQWMKEVAVLGKLAKK